ncbi:hypothetical protein OXPF_39220 [Oxobacter pfennigii]|uniref:Uncharacterized protein n=1 Tax=Oxobacter pfennigii TaxID=36849 RepID=A0A0P8WV68_9CLOT|nr:hypothetical protein [Oxobacter pfennigii]KPU42143.1 hypothetical protein OXPF_39220 [Oxobacter pfennigii]
MVEYIDNDGKWSVDVDTDENGNWIEKPKFKILMEPSQAYIDRKKQRMAPTKEKINNQVREKIAERYDVIKEIQMLNQRNYPIDSLEYAEYLEYQEYREECLAWGQAEKAQYGFE